jgi:hypothetical protein
MRHRLLSHSVVDIYVGSENTHWVLHEKLLCAKSKFFSKIFWDNHKASKNHNTGNKSFGLPDEDDAPFKMFVGWLYSGHVPVPDEEKDLGSLFDLYLMGEKWAIADLVRDVLDTVRKWYRTTDTYPGLRRVQYIYANTDIDSPMRQLLVNSVARMLALEDGIPTHWDKALRKNGQLAVDIIQAIQRWKIEQENVPDARQEALQPEKDKMKAVEKAEDEQKGEPRNLGESSEQAPQQKEQQQQTQPKDEGKSEEKPLVNGIQEHEDDYEGEDEGDETLYEKDEPEQ